MTAPILAWHGSEELKADAVERMRAHRTDDAITQGAYALIDPDKAAGFRGCFHGCLTTEALIDEGRFTIADVADGGGIVGWHRQTERIFGIPRAIGDALDDLFEGLPAEECGQFAVDVTEAIPVGADLTGLLDALALDVLTDPEHGIAAHIAPGSRAAQALAAFADLYRRRIAGADVHVSQWHEAYQIVKEHCPAAAPIAAVAGDVDMVDLLHAQGIPITWLAARTVLHLAAAPVPASMGEGA